MKARDNPFNTQRILTVRYQLQSESWERLLNRLDELRYRAAIVGEQGAGKTTLLEDLGEHLNHRGWPTRWIRPQPGKATRHSLPSRFRDEEVILLDSSEQIPRREWQRFMEVSQNARGLIITSHEEGRLPTLLRCETSPELLAKILTQLIPGRHPDLSSVANDLYHRHAGNLRDAIRELYDWCADDQFESRCDAIAARTIKRGAAEIASRSSA